MSRIARAKHETPVSRILSIAVKVLKREENASPVIYDTTPHSSGRRSDRNSHDARALPARYRRLRHGGALPTSHDASRHHVVRRRSPKTDNTHTAITAKLRFLITIPPKRLGVQITSTTVATVE